MAEPIRAIAPPVLRPLLPDSFDRPGIVETRATCGDCAMCKKPGEVSVEGAAHFIPDAKCCTYEPTLPNYLAGAILADDDPSLAEGQARIRARIASRNVVLPAWIAPSRKYRLVLDAARSTAFGRTTALLCPYFDAGRCTIWKHRESVCSTFFCKYTSGAYGFFYWRALKLFLGHVEMALARWAVTEVDATLSTEDPLRLPLTIADVEDRPPDDATYAAQWGAWAGREEELYRACFERVSALSRERLAEIALESPRGREVAANLDEAYARLTKPALAERLVLAEDLLPSRTKDGVVVVPYSRYDAQLLSESLYEILKMLKGDEGLEAFVERIRLEHEVEVPKDLLLQLQMLGVLVPPKDDARPASG